MWYLVLRRPVKPREEWTVNLDQHLVWMKEQHESGRVLFSGPTADRKLGVYVVRAGSKEEAHKATRTPPPVFVLLIFSNGKSTRSWASGLLRRPNCALTIKVFLCGMGPYYSQSDKAVDETGGEFSTSVPSSEHEHGLKTAVEKKLQIYLDSTTVKR